MTLSRVSDTSGLSPALIQAYRETHYLFAGPPSLILRVDEHNPGLALLHAQYGVTCSAVITAFNPFSIQVPPEQNAKRQALLAQRLRHGGFTFLNGIGQHPSNDWPGEPSFLVLGVSLDEARTLGVLFEQNAIVWSGEGAVPELVLLK